VLPSAVFWQEPVVTTGEQVANKQLLARGTTVISFPANIWAFTILVLILGVTTGIGKAAVYKHIAEYYPKNVGVVGGIVGVIGGLGGFLLPIVFGYFLEATRIWSTMWFFFAVLTIICLVWMHIVVTRMLNRRAPDVRLQIEDYKELEPAAGGQR
jgi:NNP family nitrate/nitrite transporter-like MFS transporter